MTRRPWTPAEQALVRSMYPHCATADVAALLGRATNTVYQQAAALGLRKTRAYLDSLASGRIQRGQQHPAMRANQFQPGMVPWNKGRSYQAGGRSVQTRFRPGNKPHTWLPVGSYRVTLSKGVPILERKMTETPGPNHMRWVPVSRLVWEKAHGPVPAGHLVVFRDPKQRTTVLADITLDKLECITRAEHARRNHPRTKSPELAMLVQLKGAIARQVNRINREAQEARA